MTARTATEARNATCVVADFEVAEIDVGDAALLLDDHVPVDPKRLSRLSELLLRAEPMLDRYRLADMPCTGLERSLAQAEVAYRGLDGTWPEATVSTALAWLQMLVVGAAETCVALGQLAADAARPLGIGPGSALARSVLEFSARAWWMAELRIGPAERVGRMHSDWLYSSQQAERLAVAADQADVLDGLSATSDTVRGKATLLGLSPLPDRPSSTALVAGVVGDTLYRPSSKIIYLDLSAKVHGTSFGVMQSFQRTEERVGKHRWLARRADQRLIEGTCLPALLAYVAAVRRIVQLLGWGLVRIDAYQASIEGFVYQSP